MIDWKKIAVKVDTTLEKAINILDDGGLRILLVWDDQGLLLGTITDGDIRRALIRHVSMDTLVADIMCSSPHVAYADWTRDEMRSLMERNRLLHLPIVNQKGMLLGIETLHGVLDKVRIDNPVFLMAGGFGKRLYPLTKDCPKPMLRVGDKPILELILQSFIDSGFHNFYVSTHYLPEKIRDYFGNGGKWGVTIKYVHEKSPLGTGGALGLLPQDEIGLPIILMNGDLLARVNYRSLLDFHSRDNATATVCVREFKTQIPYGVIKGDLGRITSIIEKPTQHFFINAGIYVLSTGLISRVRSGEVIDMPDLIEREISDGQTVNMYPLHEYWLDIGQMGDFQRAQEDAWK